jgi:hypothetical protein
MGKGYHRLKSIPHKKDVLGSFGYSGDITPDRNSEHGIGAHCDHMIPGYSAALTTEGAEWRGVGPGEEFQAGGRTFRYDDHAPSRVVHGGKSYEVSKYYVDVFDPGHPPDKAVTGKHQPHHITKAHQTKP